MPYGTVKVDNITFDNGGADQNVTVSGIHRAITSGVTVTGTISGAVLIGTTTVSGATVTGTIVQGTTVQGVSGTFTSLTGTTTTGTTANFVSGVFTTRVSGTTITGNTGQFTSGTFVSLTGTTITGTTVNAVTVSSTTGIFGSITGTTITGTTINGATVNATTGNFTSLTGVTVTGTTARFVSGVFTTQVSGLTVTGTQSSFTSGNFITLSGATATFTSGVIAPGTEAAPSLSILGDPNTGIYSPGANQVAVATNGTGKLSIDSVGNISFPGCGLRARTGRIFDADVSNSGITIFGGAGDGANIELYGGSHATLANLAVIDADEVRFRNAAGGSERLRITSAGLVGIGTSSPAALFHTAGAGLFRAALIGTEATLPAESASLSLLNGASYGTTPSVSFNIGSHNWDAVNTNNTFRWSITTPSPSAGAGLRLDINSRSFDGTSTYTTTPRVTIDGTGRVGIGTTSPNALLSLRTSSTDVALNLGAGANAFNQDVDFLNSVNNMSGRIRYRADDAAMQFWTNFNERARIDSSGRLLIGTSTTFGISGLVQVQSTSPSNVLDLSRQVADTSAPRLTFTKTRGSLTTSVISGDGLGTIRFHGSDGTNVNSFGASIDAAVDGTPGANDMPGRLMFSTTADGAASPTERMRITSAGVLQVADAGNIAVGTTTGTKIGTATTQKLGFYNATPVVQPAAVANATDAASVITQLNDLLAKLRTLGIIAT